MKNHEIFINVLHQHNKVEKEKVYIVKPKSMFKYY